MKKKLALLLTACMMVTSIAGCGGQKSASETGKDTAAGSAPTKSSEPVKLVVAARGGSHVDVLNSVKGEFEKENNCTVEVLGLEAADLKQKVSLDAKNKEGAYDLMMIDDPWMPEFAQAGMMRDLTTSGYKDDPDFVKASLAIGKEPYGTGDTFALPFAGNVTLLFYNQSVLDAAKAKVPDNWEDVLKVAQSINGKNGKIGYVVRGQQGNPIVGDYLPLLWAYGGDVFDQDWNPIFDSDAGKKALEMYMQLLKNGANYEKNDIVASVSDGKAAMSLGWPSWYISKGESAAGYAEIPGKINASAEKKPSGVIGNWMMAVTYNSKNPELAQKFLEYVTSADVQKKATEFGGVPTRTSVFNDSDLSKKYPYFKTLLAATENSKVRPRTPKWSDVETAYGAELSSAISGTKSVDQALADAKTAVKQIMGK